VRIGLSSPGPGVNRAKFGPEREQSVFVVIRGKSMAHDVVTFGEAMIRLSPPNFRRLEQARSLDIQVGGAELNTAVALARLGRKSAWVSRLTANPLGRLIANHAREAGVSTEHVLFTDEDRVGLYFLEFGAAPRASSVLYDRRGAAIAGIRPGLVDWNSIFRGARWFHVTGITPALSPSAADATREALRAAHAGGLLTSLDLNYRAKLWTTAEAGKCMGELMGECDYLITTEEDVEKLFGIKAQSYAEVAALVARRFPIKGVAITLRENPLVWKNTWTAIAYADGKLLKTRSYEVEIVDRLGAGDSFAAGLIHGLLDGDLQRALDFAVAVSAIKHSIPGDFAWISREEVEALLKGPGLRISR
jgi:2-dehydro-3-deoxygluconokinase